jgi:hypothetical protein
MSAWAMILTAALVVGNDPLPKTSGEVELGLDLSGTWEGTLHAGHGNVYRIRLTRDRCRWELKNRTAEYDNPLRDDGGGRLLLKNRPGRLGIYRQETDRLTICLATGRRPTSFSEQDGQTLLTLHRVKPRK